jgi:apolipoprotein N-acyltransferase
MVIALWHFTPLSALGYFATISLEGLWSAVMFWFVVRARLRLPRLPLWAVFPLAWTAVEWAIGHQGDIRFPWLGLGTSLADGRTLIQWADLAGARGVTLWLAWCNVLIVEGLLPPAGAPRRLVRYLVPVALTILAALGYGTWRERTLPMRELGTIGLIQPNEGYEEKWQPGRQDSIMNKLVNMSRHLLSRRRADLILWPEAAIPGFFVDHPQWSDAIAHLARSEHVAILTGGLNAELHQGRTFDYFNAAFFFDSSGGRDYPVYDKRYLVPIVERVPFIPPRWIRLQWFGGFGRGRTLPVYSGAGGRFGVLICYESAFEDAPRDYRRRGADYLVNITNDAWFGHTSAPYQHASMLVMRAIETRMGVARAGNSGVSEFVDPLGKAYAVTQLNTEAAVAGHLRTSDVTTLYVRWGDWVGTLSVAAVLALGAVTMVRRRSEGT